MDLKTNYILRSLSKLTHKRWELFIISRILHRLDNDDIEFVTQQYIRRPDGTRALTDLYFPQFFMHLEIDEPHHEGKVHSRSDYLRQLDIIEATGHEVDRIKVLSLEDDVQALKPLSAIKVEIDEFVEKVRSKKAELERTGDFKPWDLEKRYSSAPVIDKGSISISDNFAFRKQIEALRCFGFTGRGYYQGAWRIKDGTNDVVWFPRLYRYDKWHNELSEDGLVISERACDEAGKISIAKQRQNYENGSVNEHIVFARAKDALGQNVFRFVGSFRMNLEKSTDDCLHFDRTQTEVSTRAKA